MGKDDWHYDTRTHDVLTAKPHLQKWWSPGESVQSSTGTTIVKVSSFKGQNIGLILGPLLFSLFCFIAPASMPSEAVAVLASTAWIATWWITEAIPIPATSLLPIILFPLTGAVEGSVTGSYADNTIFLFLGGFFIAIAMEKWNLHRRIALNIILLVGTSTQRIILGFMVATAFLSMWISNTATAMMMPMVLRILMLMNH